MSWLTELDIVCGKMTPQLAQLYLRLPRREELADCTLAGQLRGPSCAYAETLPVRVPFQDLGPGATLLAQASLVDPCFWSAKLPMLYRATFELRRGQQVLESGERWIGLRRLGADGADLLWDGKRWVLRGLCCSAVDPADMHRWRDAEVVLVSETLSATLLQAAAQQGVPVVALIPHVDGDAAAALRRWAQSPALIAAIVPTDAPIAAWRQLAPSVLLGDVIRTPGHSDSGADFQVAGLDVAPRLLAEISEARKPVVVLQPGWGSLEDARTSCDALQRQVAASGEAAGLIV